MAFYKLFYIVHHRTDYHKLHRMVQEMMHPELYAEKKKRAHDAMMRLLTVSSMVHGICGDNW